MRKFIMSDAFDVLIWAVITLAFVGLAVASFATTRGPTAGTIPTESGLYLYDAGTDTYTAVAPLAVRYVSVRKGDSGVVEFVPGVRGVHLKSIYGRCLVGVAATLEGGSERDE